MIVDKLENAARYAGVHPALPQAFAWLREHAGRMAEQRQEIDGERLYAMDLQTAGLGHSGTQLEAHEEYIDIHYTVSGLEEIGAKPTSDCGDVKQPYTADGDCALYNDAPDFWMALPAGTFAVLFPEDAHAPMGGQGAVHKTVIKIKLNWE